MHPIFLKKEHKELPDFFEVVIEYIDGTSGTFQVTEHHLGDKLYELMTKDDECVWVPVSNVKSFKFDKNFSKILEIKRKSSEKPS